MLLSISLQQLQFFNEAFSLFLYVLLNIKKKALLLTPKLTSFFLKMTKWGLKRQWEDKIICLQRKMHLEGSNVSITKDELKITFDNRGSLLHASFSGFQLWQRVQWIQKNLTYHYVLNWLTTAPVFHQQLIQPRATMLRSFWMIWWRIIPVPCGR